MRLAYGASALVALCILGAFIACSGSSSPPSGSGDLADGGSSGAQSSSGTSSSSGGSSSGSGSGSSGAGESSSGDASLANVTDGATVITSDSGPASTYLPPVTGTCPTLATGTLTFAGQQVEIWSGAQPLATPGSLVMFWYGTGGSSADALYFLGQAQIDAITAAGGIVAAFSTSTMSGTDTGDNVWYTGDFATADEVVACALQQKWIDPSRIYTTGDSAGGLQATWMAYARSGYLAAVAPISGGLAGEDGFYAAPVDSPQDPGNVPAAIVTHGAEGVDVVVIDFAVASAAYEADIASKGGFSVDCNTGGGHVGGPPAICPAIWQFFEDHPFGAKQKYPSGLPASFPSYCQIGPREADGGP